MLPAEIDKLLAVLDERERYILTLRFGLDRGEPRTPDEVGQLVNLSRERVRQIEARALARLPPPLGGDGRAHCSPANRRSRHHASVAVGRGRTAARRAWSARYTRWRAACSVTSSSTATWS